MQIITDLTIIKNLATQKETENDRLKLILKQNSSAQIDEIVHQLNDEISEQIDCTQCGNCCRSLMINVTTQETESLADHLKMDVVAVKEAYLEESQQGQLIINTIPCHFLNNSSCTIYENRFHECREFPHLHKPNFTGRLFGTLMYYGICPIIFNVVENLKERLDIAEY